MLYGNGSRRKPNNAFQSRRQEVKRAVNCCFLRFCYWGKEETSCNRKVCESKVPEEYKQRRSYSSCQYLNQQKAWMTSDILHKLLSQLKGSFKAQNRSILLFIDSAGCHPCDFKGSSSNIKRVFFFCKLHVQAATLRSRNNAEL